MILQLVKTLTTQKLVFIESITNFLKDNIWYVTATSVTLTYVAALQFLGHLILAFNRFTLIWFPVKHKSIWKKQWYTVAIIMLPFLIVSWRLHQPVIFISNIDGSYYVKFVNGDISSINYTVTSFFYFSTTCLAGILNFLSFIKFLFHRKNNTALHVNEKNLLFVSLICFISQVVRCSYNFGRIFNDPNVLIFLTAMLPYLNDIFAWSGSISLMVLSSLTRKVYKSFYLCKSNVQKIEPAKT